MFPWDMLSGKNGQMNEWMKKLSNSGMEQHLEKLFAKIGNEPNFLNKMNPSHDPSLVEVIETTEYIFVKIQLPEEFKIEQLKIAYSFNKLFIEGLTEKKQSYLLPAIVRKKDAKVHLHDAVLELQLPKHQDMQLVEIDLSHL